MAEEKTKRVGRWYFGGLASAGAAGFTHPLDLLKVHLQTQQKAQMRLVGMGVQVVKNDGFLALYNGLSASICRQVTYSGTRFFIYEGIKDVITKDNKKMPFCQKVLLGGFSGAVGGFCGAPADMVNVRMQNDMRLPADQRRNYKHVIDGLWKVIRHEGVTKLFSGASMASTRAVFVTIGQLSFYDQFKQMLLQTGFFKDNMVTHFTGSLLAGGVATLITMPFDVMKTRFMSSKPGTYSGLLSCAKEIAVGGPMGFFKGFIPAFVRLGPHTVLIFLFFEQLRINFGYIPK